MSAKKAERMEPGAVLVRWPDGSGIVRGTGSNKDFLDMVQLLSSQGVDNHTALGVAQSLHERGFTLRASVPADPRAFTGEEFDFVGGTLPDIESLPETTEQRQGEQLA